MADLLSKRQGWPTLIALGAESQNCYPSSYESSHGFYPNSQDCGSAPVAWRRLKPMNRLPCAQINDNSQLMQKSFYPDTQVTNFTIFYGNIKKTVVGIQITDKHFILKVKECMIIKFCHFKWHMNRWLNCPTI